MSSLNVNSLLWYLCVGTTSRAVTGGGVRRAVDVSGGIVQSPQKYEYGGFTLVGIAEPQHVSVAKWLRANMHDNVSIVKLSGCGQEVLSACGLLLEKLQKIQL